MREAQEDSNKNKLSDKQMASMFKCEFLKKGYKFLELHEHELNSINCFVSPFKCYMRNATPDMAYYKYMLDYGALDQEAKETDKMKRIIAEQEQKASEDKKRKAQERD